LIRYMYDSQPDKHITFTELIKTVLKELEGSFVFVFKSIHYLNEVVTACHSSPLLIGIKTNKKLKVDFVDVEFAGQDNDTKVDSRTSNMLHCRILVLIPLTMQLQSPGSMLALPAISPKVLCMQSCTFMSEDGLLQPIEFYIASDAAVVVEHIAEGELHIHCLQRTDGDGKEQTAVQAMQMRSIEMLELEIAVIIKGKFNTFMQKEIYEQPESVVNTMHEGVNFDDNKITLRRLCVYLPMMRCCWRILFIACRTSYHLCLVMCAIFEEPTEISVSVQLAADFLDRKMLIFRDNVCLFLSQSGETADTILVLRYCLEQGA
ncbi:hypothetical protein B0H17DRAFT_855492, partial [Mycena rosella]